MNFRSVYAHARGLTAPGPRGGLVLGNLRDLWRDGMHRVLSDAWMRYGDLVSIRFGAKVVYLVVRPEHVHHILVGNRDNYNKQSHRARPLIGDGLPASNGELWKRQRSLLQPRFQSRFMPQFAGDIQDAIACVAERWGTCADRGQPLNISVEMTRLTLDAIVRSMTSERLVDEDSELRDAIRTAIEFVAASGQVFRLPLGLPTPANIRFSRALSVIDAFIAKAIQAQERRPAESSLLTFLLNARDEEDRGMPKQLVRDEAVNLLLAVHESTAQALCWVWYLLDTHRDVRKRMHEEIDSTLAGRIPTVDDRGKLPWMSAVIQEALRLYPPFWVFPRHAINDDRIGGHLVPAGATMMLCPYFTHRLPELWEEPERFRPERFLDGSAQARLHRASYYPFGYGQRTCIGNHLATMEMQLVVAMLAQKFELTCSPSAPPVEPEFSTALRPRGGLWMRVRRRHMPVHPSQIR